MQLTKNVCKLVVCDLDGTLLDKNKQMDPDFLRVMKEKNIPFTFATGRNYHIVKDLIKEYHVYLPYITNNGANIFIEDTCIYQQNIVEKELKLAIEILLSKDISFLMYSQDEIVSYGKDPRLEHFKQRLIGKCNITDFYTIQQVFLQEYFKIVMIGENLDTLCQSINISCKNTFACRSEDTVYTITYRSATKGKALLNLLKMMNINLNEVYVFGDNHNDVSMFSVVENSVAMAHSDDCIKIKAKYVTDCVSSFIEKYL